MKAKVFGKILFLSLLLLAACYTDSQDHLYDKVGFDPGAAPYNPDPRINHSIPNYYYRYGPTVPVSNYAPQYQYAPTGYAPHPPQQVAPYQAPASRFYANPYDIPPSPYYAQPYDTDQYYVPPSYYYGQDQQQPTRYTRPTNTNNKGGRNAAINKM
jgi:hypothetical protein